MTLKSQWLNTTKIYFSHTHTRHAQCSQNRACPSHNDLWTQTDRGTTIWNMGILQNREERDTAWSFMGFSLPQLSTDKYFIGQNYPDGTPNFLGPGNGTWEAYLMRIIVPDTLRLCKDVSSKKNETVNKGLQIWWRKNTIITQDTWQIPSEVTLSGTALKPKSLLFVEKDQQIGLF